MRKSFPGLLWAGWEEAMTAQKAGRAASALGKRCQGPAGITAAYSGTDKSLFPWMEAEKGFFGIKESLG